MHNLIINISLAREASASYLGIALRCVLGLDNSHYHEFHVLLINKGERFASSGETKDEIKTKWKEYKKRVAFGIVQVLFSIHSLENFNIDMKSSLTPCF